jgi:hypothetical protein
MLTYTYQAIFCLLVSTVCQPSDQNHTDQSDWRAALVSS